MHKTTFQIDCTHYHAHSPTSPKTGSLHIDIPIVATNTADPESDLHGAPFDPMTDRKKWSVWRTAVTGRIMDEVRRLERAKAELEPSWGDPHTHRVAPGPYGKCLEHPPLRKYIRVGGGSREMARGLMHQGQGKLLPSQFVYFGIPRVYIPGGTQEGKST